MSSRSLSQGAGIYFPARLGPRHERTATARPGTRASPESLRRKRTRSRAADPETRPAKITVLSAGARLARAVVKKALAVGADELVLLEDDGYQSLDSYATIRVLAAAIRKLGGCDLVLCGRQASDTDAGQVGPGLAEYLDLPVITHASERSSRLEKEMSWSSESKTKVSTS